MSVAGIFPVRLARATAVTLLLTGCGASAGPSTSGSAAATRSQDAANLAQTANDPRTADPTASRPTNLLPTTGSAKKPPAPLPSSPTTPTEPTPATPASTVAKSTKEAPTKIGARHVLIQWMGSERAGKSVVRSREQALVVAQEALKRARNKEDFARLAIEYSDEPGAGSRGGSLGRFGRGQMVGAFDEAAFKLEVGQISEIIETPFGFHIIQRTE